MSKILKVIISFLASALVLSCSNEPVSEAINNSSTHMVSMGTMHNELLNEFFKTSTRTDSPIEIKFEEILSLSYEVLSRYGIDDVLTSEMQNECEELVETFVRNLNAQGYLSLYPYFDYLDVSPSDVDELRTAYVSDCSGNSCLFMQTLQDIYSAQTYNNNKCFSDFYSVCNSSCDFWSMLQTRNESKVNVAAYVADALGSLAGSAIGGVVGGLAVSAIFSLQVDTYDSSTPPGDVD